MLLKRRSYVRREGRMTEGQRKGLSEGWSQFGIDHCEALKDLPSLFGREALCNMEIGFGMGVELVAAAEAYPEQNFLGVEVYRPGVGSVLRQLLQKELNHVRLAAQDVVEVIRYGLKDASLYRIMILFPDPWPKKKHHKRRLVQADFIEQLAWKTQSGGILMIVTDDDSYAQHICDIMQAQSMWVHVNHIGDDKMFNLWSMTKYHRRAKQLGHCIHAFYFRRS